MLFISTCLFWAGCGRLVSLRKTLSSNIARASRCVRLNAGTAQRVQSSQLRGHRATSWQNHSDPLRRARRSSLSDQGLSTDSQVSHTRHTSASFRRDSVFQVQQRLGQSSNQRSTVRSSSSFQRFQSFGNQLRKNSPRQEGYEGYSLVFQISQRRNLYRKCPKLVFQHILLYCKILSLLIFKISALIKWMLYFSIFPYRCTSFYFACLLPTIKTVFVVLENFEVVTTDWNF